MDTVFSFEVFKIASLAKGNGSKWKWDNAELLWKGSSYTLLSTGAQAVSKPLPLLM